MNKTELIQRIEQIPKFVMRDVAVKDTARDLSVPDKIEEGKTYIREETQVENWIEDEYHKAVTEEGNTVPLAFVSKNYALVQFESVFKPLIQNIEELDGYIIYYNGVGIMDVFPDDEKLLINGNDKIGIVAYNSVDTTSSVIIKFCVRHGERQITIPKSLAGFKRVHIGKAIQITQNFLTVVDKVRKIWRTIITEFEKVKVNETYVTAMLDDVKIKDKYLRKKVLKRILEVQDMDLWDTFLYIIEIIEQRSFKSDLHRRKKLDLISDKIFKHAVVSRLINA